MAVSDQKVLLPYNVFLDPGLHISSMQVYMCTLKRKKHESAFHECAFAYQGATAVFIKIIKDKLIGIIK